LKKSKSKYSILKLYSTQQVKLWPGGPGA
jgi:hypothetical protein